MIGPRHPETVAEIRKSLYVDDLISGAPTTNEAAELKQDAIEIFDDAKFRLHKWHSNAPELESDMNDGALTFAKQQLRVSPKENGSKLSGLKWNKVENSLQVDFPSTPAVLTKRGLLAYLAKVYDPLGLLSPMLLEGKILYREVCEAKVRWDGFIPDDLSKRWRKWESALSRYLSFPRSIPTYREPIQEVQLHSFGDASKKGLCAVVYAVVQQESGKVQRLVTAKSRLAKTNLTIPRLELVAGHMAVNLAVNVRNALEGFKMAENIHCWLDSSVALHWLNDDGQYRQFVANRVNKIRSHPNVLWRHVPTAENPADLGSRGSSVDGPRLWCQGPDWLSDESRWPPKLVTKANNVSDVSELIRIPGYATYRKDRSNNQRGGLCTYISSRLNVIELGNLCEPEIETQWFLIKTDRLPRGINSIVLGTVYQPPQADDRILRSHIFNSLDSLLATYPNSAIMLLEDFNQFKPANLCSSFKLKKLATKPTRGNNTLDQAFSTLLPYYESIILPPVASSDHSSVLLQPTGKPTPSLPTMRFHKRDSRASNKRHLIVALENFNWTPITRVKFL